MTGFNFREISCQFNVKFGSSIYLKNLIIFTMDHGLVILSFREILFGAQVVFLLFTNAWNPSNYYLTPTRILADSHTLLAIIR